MDDFTTDDELDVPEGVLGEEDTEEEDEEDELADGFHEVDGAAEEEETL